MSGNPHTYLTISIVAYFSRFSHIHQLIQSASITYMDTFRRKYRSGALARETMFDLLLSCGRTKNEGAAGYIYVNLYEPLIRKCDGYHLISVQCSTRSNPRVSCPRLPSTGVVHDVDWVSCSLEELTFIAESSLFVSN